MQKPCFVSKVEVLPASQRISTCAARVHGVVGVGGEGANADAELLIVFGAQTVRFCYRMRTLLCNVFFGLRSKASFRTHFTNLPRAALLVAGRALVVGPWQNADSVPTICSFC